jgi:hypothetical protein
MESSREAPAAPVIALRPAWRSSPWAGLGGVMALGLGLRVWRLDQNGFGTIGTSIHYPVPAHRQPAYHHLGYTEGQFPCAERACREVLSLPLYPELTEDELRYVATAVKTFNG